MRLLVSRSSLRSLASRLTTDSRLELKSAFGVLATLIMIPKFPKAKPDNMLLAAALQTTVTID